MILLQGTSNNKLIALMSLYFRSSGRAIISSMRLVFFLSDRASIDLGKVSNICSNAVMLLVLIRSLTVLKRTSVCIIENKLSKPFSLLQDVLSRIRIVHSWIQNGAGRIPIVFFQYRLYSTSTERPVIFCNTSPHFCNYKLYYGQNDRSL